jgi:antitoxin component YwqK of YwqJK toxin-antitoxin module
MYNCTYYVKAYPNMATEGSQLYCNINSVDTYEIYLHHDGGYYNRCLCYKKITDANGIKNGLEINHESDGYRKEKTYVNSIMHGPLRYYNSKGVLLHEHYLYKGLIHGSERSYYNGKLSYEHKFVYGAGHGVNTKYLPNGNIIEHMYHIDNKEVAFDEYKAYEKNLDDCAREVGRIGKICKDVVSIIRQYMY